MELSREEKPREKRVVHIVGSLCCLRWGGGVEPAGGIYHAEEYCFDGVGWVG